MSRTRLVAVAAVAVVAAGTAVRQVPRLLGDDVHERTAQVVADAWVGGNLDALR